MIVSSLLNLFVDLKMKLLAGWHSGTVPDSESNCSSMFWGSEQVTSQSASSLPTAGNKQYCNLIWLVRAKSVRKAHFARHTASSV